MTAFLFRADTATRFERSDLRDGFDEKWLQDLLFREPDLMPLSEIDPSAGGFIPVCRELAMPRPGGISYLDIFGITPGGRPVLVECKLWRNPQARREVIAQILEYAALLRRWSYSDLTSRLRSRLSGSSENPLYDLAVSAGGALGEAAFCDAVSRNLRRGDFQLIVAGDGIREDANAIVEHIADRGARFALVEFQRWRDGEGGQLIVPSIPFRTEVYRQRVLTDPAGNPVLIEAEEGQDMTPDAVALPERNAGKDANRQFWQSFIDTVRFDHPDQAPPRHGGNNWVRIELPSPARRLTVYRYQGRVGMTLIEEPGSGLIARLRDDDSLTEELSPMSIRWQRQSDPGEAVLALDQPDGTDAMVWLTATANRLVNAIRPRLDA